MSDLKPCPFCGCSATVTYNAGDDKRIQCVGCGVSGITASHWNTRPAPDAGLGTADRIARAMLDDPKIAVDFGGLYLVSETLDENHELQIHFSDGCAMLANWGPLSPATAALCRARWEALRKEKQ